MPITINTEVEYDMAIQLLTNVGQQIKGVIADAEKVDPPVDTFLMRAYYEKVRIEVMELIKNKKAKFPAPVVVPEETLGEQSPEIQSLINKYVERPEDEVIIAEIVEEN